MANRTLPAVAEELVADSRQSISPKPPEERGKEHQ
jgi:hypothetical protein